MRISILLAVVLAGVCALAAQAADETIRADDRALFEAACTQCHGLRPIELKRDGIEGWRFTVEEMVMRGAQLGPIEAQRLIRYLTANLGPGMSPMKTELLPADPTMDRMTALRAAELPAGPGRALVQGRCVLCHDLGRVVSVRRTLTDWQRYTENMIVRAGISETPGNLELMVTYLTKNFGRQPGD